MRLCWYLTSQYLQSLLTIDIIDQIDGRVQITHELYPFGSNFLYQICATYLIEVIPSALGDFTKYVHIDKVVLKSPTDVLNKVINNWSERPLFNRC